MTDASTLPTSIAGLVAAYRTGDISPGEVTETFLARVAAFDDEFHAFLRVTASLARRQAAAAEAAYGRDEQAPLLGVPVAIKDLFPVAGEVTTYGSRVHRDAVSRADSGVVRRLREAGAVIIGKTNTAEFGQSATTENRLGPPCANPWDTSRTPGGSSGGSAAAVAAHLCLVAIGSDAGGSVRIPAAFTGLVGLKPTWGRCPDEGGFRGMSPFSTPGPLTHRVADARVLLGVLSDEPLPRRDGGRLRIGWCLSPYGRPVDPRLGQVVAAAVQRSTDLGHDVVETSLDLAGWRDVFDPLVVDEEARERGHLLDDAADELTFYERRTIAAGIRQDPEMVTRARAAHDRFRIRVSALFDDVDVVATPTTAVPAFPLEQRPTAVAERPVDWLWGAFPFTAPWNVAGVPAVSLPCGFVAGLPVGLQLVAPHGHEQRLLDLAADLEEVLGFDDAPVRRRWGVDA